MPDMITKRSKFVDTNTEYMDDDSALDSIFNGIDITSAVPPTHTDSSVFIRISRGIYGHTDTTRHYTEARFRHQAQAMLLVDLVAVSVRSTETFL